MSLIDAAAALQYRGPDDLNARIQLHRRFSTNQHGWMRWAFDQFSFHPPARVLELGCGTGELWRANAHRIEAGIGIVAADASAGMLRNTRRSFAALPIQCRLTVADAQAIPFCGRTFDAVIANHLLYHVPDIGCALADMARVLKPNGLFYATTNGLGHLHEIPLLLQGFNQSIECPLSGMAQAFGLENGADQLHQHFARVELRRYTDSLEVTEAKPLVDYVLSLRGVGNVGEKVKGSRIEELESFFAGMIRERGAIRISKDSGMFVSAVEAEG